MFFIGIQALAAAIIFIAGVANLIFPIFGENSVMTTLVMYSLAASLANSARIDIIIKKTRDSSDNKGWRPPKENRLPNWLNLVETHDAFPGLRYTQFRFEPVRWAIFLILNSLGASVQFSLPLSPGGRTGIRTPETPWRAYTLSRRASSTTPAPFLVDNYTTTILTLMVAYIAV